MALATTWSNCLQSDSWRRALASNFINSLQASRYHVLHTLGTFDRREYLGDLVILLYRYCFASHHTPVPVWSEFAVFYVTILEQLLVRFDVCWVDDVVEVMRGILPNVAGFCKGRISQEGRDSCQRLRNENQTGIRSLTLRYILCSLFPTVLQRRVRHS
jgi:hypothetical protein